MSKILRHNGKQCRTLIACWLEYHNLTCCHPVFQGIYNSLREHQHQIEAVNRHGGQFIREAKVFNLCNLLLMYDALAWFVSDMSQPFHDEDRLPWQLKYVYICPLQP